MAEPFSIAAGILSAADVFSKTSTKIVELTRTWKSAPVAVLAIANEIADMTVLLDRLRESGQAMRKVDPERDAASITALEDQLNKAKAVVSELDDLIDTLQQLKKTARRNLWVRREAKALRMQKELRGIRRKISDLIISYTMTTTSRIELELQSVQMNVQSARDSSEADSAQIKQTLLGFQDSMIGVRENTSLVERELVRASLESVDRDQTLHLALTNLQTQTSSFSDRTINELSMLVPRLIETLKHPTQPTGAGSSLALHEKSTAADHIMIQLGRSRRPCFADCVCACHSYQRGPLHSQLRTALGSLFLGYFGYPIQRASCDKFGCLNRKRLQLKVTYIFPSWLLHYAICSVFEYSSACGPAFGIAARRRIPWPKSDLFYYSFAGDAAGISSVLAANQAMVNDLTYENGQTPLYFTIAIGTRFNANAARTLLRAGADPFIKDDSGLSVYDIAIRAVLKERAHPHRSAVAAEIKTVFSIPEEQFDKIGLTHIHKLVLRICSSRDDEGLLKEIQRSPEDLNTSDDLGLTPLDWAALRGDVQAAEVLIAAGADVNLELSGLRYRPTIVWALECYNAACVDTLIAAGADLEVESPYEMGYRPLDHASSWNRPAAVRSLLEAGVDPECGHPDFSHGPLIFAAREGAMEVARALIVHGANVDKRDSIGNTPLLDAVRMNRHDCVRLCLHSKADLNIRNKQGQSVLHLAAQRGDIVTMRILGALSWATSETEERDSTKLSPRQYFQRRQDRTPGLMDAFACLMGEILEVDSAETVDVDTDDDEFFEAKET